MFKIDIETCEQCGGTVKVMASIEDRLVIRRIIYHLDNDRAKSTQTRPALARAPPTTV